MKSFFFKRLFTITLIFFGLVSLVLLLGKDKTGPILNVLEVLLIAYCGGSFLWARSKHIPVITIFRLAVFFYISLSFLYAIVLRGANVLDFLMIYKSFFYLFLLSFLVDKRLMEAKHVLKFFNLILGIFLLKYILVLGLGIKKRPVVYEENNFELMLLYSLYLVRYSITTKKHLHYLALVGFITLISLSRSSLIMYSVLVFYIFYSTFKRTWVFIIPFVIALMGLVVAYIFAQRSGQSLEETDRFRFMLVFLNEVKNWNLLQWLFGNERITPLSYEACQVMNYWQNLFSFSGDGTCYSVILHSFLLRVLLDHGIIGFLFIIYFTYMLLAKSGVTIGHRFLFLAIVVLNGFSVSSFNNLFFAISMVFLMTTNRHLSSNQDKIATLNR